MRNGPVALLALLRKFTASYGPEKCFPGQDWLAQEKFFVNKRTIYRWTQQLIAEGKLVRHSRGPRTSLYTVQMAEVTGQNVHSFVHSNVHSSAVGPYINSESINRREAPAMPPRIVRNEWGREVPNPEWLRINAVLREARDRITRAKDPIAYEQALLRAELRKPPAKEMGGRARAASVAASQ